MQSVPARYASTVVLVRPCQPRGFEILLTQRPPEMRFLGGFYVFPGGAIHPDDNSEKVFQRCRGVTPDDARRILGGGLDRGSALTHWVAALRELFEEVGVLLCVKHSGAAMDLNNEATKKRIEKKRMALTQDAVDFGTFLESEDLYCDLSRLVYIYHRVTPEIYSMRFDTRFFLASLPPRQTALPCSEEVTESLWIEPRKALKRAFGEGFPIVPPTTTVLESLARISSWNELRTKYGLTT